MWIEVVPTICQLEGESTPVCVGIRALQAPLMLPYVDKLPARGRVYPSVCGQ